MLLGLHGKKTGKLMQAAITCGCILSGSAENIEKYGEFAQKLGLAFQIKDDILDVEGTIKETGKSV
jgi:geranylgeranyl diphosphate synthase type II